MAATVYLIPTILAEGKTQCIPAYVPDAVKACSVFFVENERTARRYLKLLDKSIVIDDYEWYNMKEVTAEVAQQFSKSIQQEKTIGIISEAGCPGVADPGQHLVAIAQRTRAVVKPLVGPNSILLALMASGMNGQQFCFHGYLPIQQADRIKSIKTLEAESKSRSLTQIFIETPYRNDQMLEALLKICQPQTRICVAADLTANSEWVVTKTVAEWKKEKPALHKRPALFLLYAGEM